jgi:CRISPR-associated protein Csb2
MTTIRLTFPAARYHATPWGRHVNEGVPEWPPSPYRLLRALYDVWKRKCFHLPDDAVGSILEALATSPPSFALPNAVATHTRSYLSANTKDPSDKNLVFDPFLVFDRPHACYMCWPDLCLSPQQRETLSVLLQNLNYLGRSESWVQAELWDGRPEGPFESFVADVAEGDQELEKVACAVPLGEYKGKQSWMDALTFSTTDLLKDRASSPPLLRHVRYALPKDAITVDPPRKFERKPAPVYAVLLGLDATVLPLVTATLEVAEQVRCRLMGAHKKRKNGDESQVSPLFSGKTTDGKKRLDHGHVYILPRGNADGRIDRILIMSRLRPFDRDEIDAVRGVRKLWQRDGRPDVQCVVTWQGALDAPVERKPSRIVESATPFVLPRHWRKGRDFQRFMEEEVRRECRNHSIGAEPATIEPLSAMPGLYDVVEYRRNRKDDPVRPGYALRLTFDTQVPAPFAIGYCAHFGLGQFQPAR